MEKVRVAIRVTEDGVPLMPEVRIGKPREGYMRPGEVYTVDKTVRIQRLLHPFQTLVEVREGDEAPQPGAQVVPAEDDPTPTPAPRRRRTKTAADL